MRIRPGASEGRQKGLGNRFKALLCCWAVGGWLAGAWAQGADRLQAQDLPNALAEELPARFEQMRRAGAVQLGQRPVYLQSTETAQRLEGEVLALIEHPLQTVRTALAQAPAWCDILILHLNVKYCRVVREAGAAATPQTLEVGLGRKFDEPLSSAHWLHFGFRAGTAAGEAGPRGSGVELHAAEGPLDTRDIRIHVNTAAAGEGRTLLQLRYTYAQGPAARWALQLYLGTVGRQKVGFSLVPDRSDRSDRSERPAPANAASKPVAGVRGLLERNTVRYYLAVDAYLDALALPPAQQLERRLLDWFAATERHPVQLRELDWETYVQMKRLEVRRQQSPAPGRP